MIGLIGITIVLVMVFGGYLLAGGKMGIILKSLPFEMIMIGGAAIGAFVISNDGSAIRHTVKDIAKVFKGPKWKPDDYKDLMCLLFELIRISRTNPVDLEQHIEAPDASPVFQKYPRILKDSEITALICDTLRSMTMNYDDPHQVEEVLEKRLEANLHHAAFNPCPADHGRRAAGAGDRGRGAGRDQDDGIDRPPREILGKMIGGALVGTFLGVFLSYGLVGPFAARLKTVLEDEAHFQQLVREILVANLHQHAPNICVEVGRQNTPTHIRPSFGELEQSLKATRDAA